MPISMAILLEILHYYYFNMKGRLFYYYLWGFIANFLLQEIRVFLEVKFPVPTAEGLICFLQCILETSLASNQTICINIYINVMYYPPDRWKTFFNRLGISSFDEKNFQNTAQLYFIQRIYNKVFCYSYNTHYQGGFSQD